MELFKKIPLAKILKGKLLKIAEMQDLIILELLRKFDFVLHGGTAVWRVYGGKRFSFDIDLYYKKPEKIAEYFTLQKIFRITKKRITSGGVLYLKLKEEEEVELNVSPFFKKIKSVEKEFWLIDGSNITIKTLSPEDLVKEKISAFLNRKKARDLYDIYYLLDFCDTRKIKSELNILAEKISKPRDFHGLREIILIGKTPSFKAIEEKVKKVCQRKNMRNL